MAASRRHLDPVAVVRAARVMRYTSGNFLLFITPFRQQIAPSSRAGLRPQTPHRLAQRSASGGSVQNAALPETATSLYWVALPRRFEEEGQRAVRTAARCCTSSVMSLDPRIDYQRQTQRESRAQASWITQRCILAAMGEGVSSRVPLRCWGTAQAFTSTPQLGCQCGRPPRRAGCGQRFGAGRQDALLVGKLITSHGYHPREVGLDQDMRVS
jgi:hypothetical protein